MVPREGSDTPAASDFGEFDGRIAVEVDAPAYAEIESGVVSGSQHSRLTDGGIFIAGDFDAHTMTTHGSLGVSSDADVTFQLAASRAYVLAYTGSTGSSAGNPSTLIALEAEGRAPVFDIDAPGTRSGTLAAGRYRFLLHHGDSTGPGESGSIRRAYSVELALNR